MRTPTVFALCAVALAAALWGSGLWGLNRSDGRPAVVTPDQVRAGNSADDQYEAAFASGYVDAMLTDGGPRDPSVPVWVDAVHLGPYPRVRSMVAGYFRAAGWRVDYEPAGDRYAFAEAARRD